MQILKRNNLRLGIISNLKLLSLLKSHGVIGYEMYRDEWLKLGVVILTKMIAKDLSRSVLLDVAESVQRGVYSGKEED